jgi:hypothetical protein
MISRKNEPLIVAASMAADVVSDPIDVKNIIVGSIQLTFTGSPVGSMKLQCSNDVYDYLKQPGIQPAAVNWTDIDTTTLSVTASGSIVYNLTSIGYDQLRVVYTRTSGTGVLNARMVGKG